MKQRFEDDDQIKKVSVKNKYIQHVLYGMV